MSAGKQVRLNGEQYRALLECKGLLNLLGRNLSNGQVVALACKFLSASIHVAEKIPQEKLEEPLRNALKDVDFSEVFKAIE